LPELYTITPDWIEQQWYNTGGTRAKKYLLAPDGKFYYFKKSQIKLGKNFKYEFWNEIIAYEVGTLLGFYILRYDIAVDGEKMGCISESMIYGEQKLNEGIKYLQAYKTEFDPTNRSHRNLYNFEFIEKALHHLRIHEFIKDLLELIVLDSLIGNGDRHQENWAFITVTRPFTEKFSAVIKYATNAQEAALRLIKSKEEKIKAAGLELPPEFDVIDYSFAPIYDSGSSLARELLPEKVEQLLHSETELKKYILKGTSEIHWGDKKLSHFDLIRNLLSSPHKGAIKGIIERVMSKYDKRKVEQIIKEIDQKVPETHIEYKIPATRKQLILKIITLRFEMLKELIK